MSTVKKPTQFYATASTAIVLVMLSLFLLLFLHSTHITDLAKESLNILVELDDSVFEDQQIELSKQIASYPGIKPGSVEILNKESAKQYMQQELSVLDSTYENPLKNVIKFNLESKSYTESNLKTISSKIELEKGVLGVYYENENIEMLKANLKRLSLGILTLALCFVLLALAIIFNTIKLTLYSDVKEIKTMQMVGAENRFIKKPYLRSAFYIALKSILIMLIVILGIYTYSTFGGGSLQSFLDYRLVALTIVVSSIAALILQLVTTNLIINKFLKSNISK